MRPALAHEDPKTNHHLKNALTASSLAMWQCEMVLQKPFAALLIFWYCTTLTWSQSR